MTIPMAHAGTACCRPGSRSRGRSRTALADPELPAARGTMSQMTRTGYSPEAPLLRTLGPDGQLVRNRPHKAPDAFFPLVDSKPPVVRRARGPRRRRTGGADHD